MADKTTKIIEIEVELEGDEKVTKQFEQLADGTQKAVDSAEKLDAKFEDVYKNIEPLTTRMGEAEDRLYELALAGDTTSKEYNELLKSVGNYRKVQIQTDLAVDAAATTFSQKLGGALTGATSGFAAVQGVMGLVGSESEALEETLLKVQSALALQQGVQGVLEYSKSIGLAGKATKVFNLIVKANPLALLVTTIVAIIGYFAIFTDSIDVAIQGLKNLGDAIGLTNFAEQELEEKREERHKEEKQRQLDEIALLKQKQRIAEEDFQRNLAFQESLGKSTARLRKAKVLERIEDAKARAALLKGTVFEKEAQRTLIELRTELNNINKEIRAENKAGSDEKKKQDNEEIARQKELARLQEEALDKQIEEEIALQQTFDAIQRENEDRFRTTQENELLLVQEKYDTLQAMAFGNAEALEQIEIARLNELNDVKLKFANEEVGIEQDKNKKIVEVEELTNRKKLELASASFTAIADLVGSFNTQNAKDAERQFKIQKAFNLAAAVTNTALAVTGALTAGGNPIKLATGAQFVEAGIAAAVGAANIVKIASSQFGQGDTGATQDISAPSVQAPNFNVVGDSGVNQLATLQQQPTQAFVVSGEVTTAQALDRNRVQNATL